MARTHGKYGGGCLLNKASDHRAVAVGTVLSSALACCQLLLSSPGWRPGGRNRVNYGTFVGTIGSPLYQQPVSARPARQLQFSIRARF
jgi:hypothetical protein